MEETYTIQLEYDMIIIYPLQHARACTDVVHISDTGHALLINMVHTHYIALERIWCNDRSIL